MKVVVKHALGDGHAAPTRRSKVLRRSLVATAVVIGVLVIPQPAGAVTNWQASGTVTCPNGNPVRGVWVDAGTQSGWASYRHHRNPSQASYHRRMRASSFYRLTIGCGGTTSKWRYSVRTNQRMWNHAAFHYFVMCGTRSCNAVAI